jgi:hypothetical protein
MLSVMNVPVRIAIAAALAASATVAPGAQDEALLDLLVERLGVYLTEYEAALAAVVADERYVQQEWLGRGSPGTGVANARRLLESEVGFVRLPGAREWFGIRDVRKVNGRPVKGTGVTLAELFQKIDDRFYDRAAAIVVASSEHNLGGRRTINMPVVPLEALGAQNHPRLIFTLKGTDRVRGTRTQRLDFEEFDEPTLVHDADGRSMWSRGSVWVEPATGRLWRVELKVGPDEPSQSQRPALESIVRVEFAMDRTLDMLVPIELVEEFWIPRGRGTGRARYTNFRRFETTARIIP